MGYSAKAVANYFLENYHDHAITSIKINRLVYLSHGWNYTLNGDDLVDDEFVVALPYAPTFMTLFIEFRHKGGSPIIELAIELDLDKTMSKREIVTYTPRIPESDTSVTNFLDEMWRIYGSHSTDELTRACNGGDTPWQAIRSEYPKMINPQIPNDLIKNYYKKLYKEHSELEK